MKSVKPQIEVTARPKSGQGRLTKAKLLSAHSWPTGMHVSVMVGDERRYHVSVTIPIETILEMLPKMFEERIAFEKEPIETEVE